MPETFFILLCGGIMLAAAISDPFAVTLNWLRLCGILSLAIAGLAMFFLARRENPVSAAMWMAQLGVAVAILGHLAFVQIGWRKTQEVLALIVFFVAVKIGADLIGVAVALKSPTVFDVVIYYISAIGIGVVCGLALMDMLLGHAYLTASKMTIAPFIRLNTFLAGALVWRAIFAVGVTMLIQSRRPIYMLWGIHGLYILTRWLVGLAVPAVFVYMAHDCIRRRATQSATGILYVAGVLIFIGEIIALHLVRETGLPF